MQPVSSTFKSIVRSEYSARVKLILNHVTYIEAELYSISTRRCLFSADFPTIGSAISGEIELKMDNPSVSIPKMALIEPYVQVYNETQTSEWIPKGLYYIDTREVDEATNTLTIHGYDSMLKAEQDYPDDGYDDTRTALQAVQIIAGTIIEGIDPDIEPETESLLQNNPITISTMPVGYSCREVLQNIAVLYAGNFIINDYGQLTLIPLNSVGEETNLLIDEYGDVITFGGVGIIV